MKEELLINKDLLQEIYLVINNLQIEDGACSSCHQLCNRSYKWRWLHPSEIKLFNNDVIQKNGISYFKTGKCKYLDGVLCSIYSNRPLECRLSPIYVKLIEKSIYWILDNKCNIILKSREKIAHFKDIVDNLEKNLPIEFIDFLKKIAQSNNLSHTDYLKIKKLER